MMIQTEHGAPYIIDALNQPIVPEYFWTLSAPQLDYVLTPLTYLELSQSTGIELEVNQLTVVIPSTWYVLVADPDTSSIDTVAVSDLSKNAYTAVAMSADDSKMRTMPIRCTGVVKELSCVYPLLPRDNMICHPAGLEVNRNTGKITRLSVMFGPADLNKYFDGLSIGDLF